MKQKTGSSYEISTGHLTFSAQFHKENLTKTKVQIGKMQKGTKTKMETPNLSKEMSDRFRVIAHQGLRSPTKIILKIKNLTIRFERHILYQIKLQGPMKQEI